MNRHRTVFAQLLDLAPRWEFNECVKRHTRDFLPRKFSYWDQFLTMAFAQLTQRESLRDVEVSLAALGSKTYNMGFRTTVKRSTLADANEQRDWRIWSDFALVLIKEARKLYADEPLGYEFDSAVYALDSSTVSLCLSLCPWAKFRKNKGGIKLHTQLDLRGNIPSFVLISPAKINDVKFLDDILIETGALYVMDRGYFDLARLFHFATEGAFFVTRLKRRVFYCRRKIFSRSKKDAIRCDALVDLRSKVARKKYPQRVRLIEYYDSDNKRTFLFITNNLSLAAQTIADIYKQRWQIELFFKWIKQHLRIKAFFGTSENAVKTQIWIAVSVYLIAAIAKKKLSLEPSLYTILQALSVSVAEKTPILSTLNSCQEENNGVGIPNQLDLF